MRFSITIILLLGLLCLAAPVGAQALIMRGETLPAKIPPNYFWFLDTVQNIAYRMEEQGLWDKVSNNAVKSLRACHGWMFVETTAGGSIWSDDGVIKSNVTNCLCTDSMIVVLWPANLAFYDVHGQEFQSSRCRGNNAQLDTIAGKLAVCKSAAERLMSQYPNCNEVHLWGMFGINGQWLIAPKFDTPFHFQNGFAEVIYYGQRRKINAQGEFVE